MAIKKPPIKVRYSNMQSPEPTIEEAQQTDLGSLSEAVVAEEETLCESKSLSPACDLTIPVDTGTCNGPPPPAPGMY